MSGTGVLEIRVLGAVELLLDGQAVPAGGAGERALLARLASTPGRVVPIDRLIDDLWESDLPVDPRNALQLRVSKARRLVGSALVSERHGYRLDLGDDGLDAARFERLVAQRRFEEALALWRGPAYGEFVDHGWARLESDRLGELRASALEDWLAARLESGEGASLVPELVSLVADEPLRERRRGQLMLALYRSGRTADALATYQDLRRTLRDQLGLTPSPALRQLEEAILRDDTSLAGQAPLGECPSHLPSPLTHLIGRDRELGAVAQLLAETRLLTLVGPGGSGKTSLALQAARDLAGRYRHGARFVPLAQVTDPAHLPAALADALGLADPEARSISRVLTAWLSTRDVLLVVDNCEHLVDASAELVQQLLSEAASLRVLATSREPLGIPGELQLPVPPLSPQDAVALFSERARAVRPEFTLDGVEDRVRAITDRLDGMPLAIELAAARVKAMTVADIDTRLEDRFALLTSGPRTAQARHRSLRAAIDWSFDLLDDVERTLLSRLSVFRGGWTLDAAAAVAAGAATDVLDPLSTLVDRSLVIADNGRFRLLETIRAYAEARLVESGAQEETLERHALHFAALAERAETELRGRDQASWLARLRADDANLRVALDWARQRAREHTDLACTLAGSLGWYWYVGRQMDGEEQLTSALAAASLADGPARARALLALSLAVRPAGCIVHASDRAARAAEESLRLFADTDPRRAALARLLLAVEGVAAGDATSHLEQVARARRVLAEHDDAWGSALADFVEMEIRLHHGAVDDALAFGDRAAAAFDDLGDDWGRSAVRLHLGHGLRLAGRAGAAREALDIAVEVSRATGLPNNLARSYIELGELALYEGAVDEAGPQLELADQIAGDLGSDTLRALVLLGEGAMARWRCDPAAARLAYEQALAICVSAAIPRSEARARAGLAATALDAGETDTAGEQLRRTAEIAHAIGDASLLALSYEQASRAASLSGDPGARRQLLAEADSLRAAQGRPRGALELRDLDADQASRRPTGATAAATSPRST